MRRHRTIDSGWIIFTRVAAGGGEVETLFGKKEDCQSVLRNAKLAGLWASIPAACVIGIVSGLSCQNHAGARIFMISLTLWRSAP